MLEVDSAGVEVVEGGERVLVCGCGSASWWGFCFWGSGADGDAGDGSHHDGSRVVWYRRQFAAGDGGLSATRGVALQVQHVWHLVELG